MNRKPPIEYLLFNSMKIFPLVAAIGAFAFTTLTGCSESTKLSQNTNSDTPKPRSGSVKMGNTDSNPKQKVIKPRGYLLDDYTQQEKKLLSLYGIPVANATEFQSFTTHSRAAHEKDVEAGQISMMWEYLSTAIASLPEELRINQWIDACVIRGAHFSQQLVAGKYSVEQIKAIYREEKPPNKPLPDELIAFLDRRVDELAAIRGMEYNAALSHLKISFMTDPYMVGVFLDALEKDVDPSRKRRLQELIKTGAKNDSDA